jgi:O-antigen/teichoic acid export membrane protein
MSKIISGLSSVGKVSLASLVLGLLLSKIIATLHGPIGLANFSIIKQTILTFSFFSVGAQAVVVQGIACRNGDARKSYFVQTFVVHLLIAVISALLLFGVYVLFAHSLLAAASFLFEIPVVLILVSIAFATMYFFGKSALNGFRAINELLLVEIVGPFIMIAVLFFGFYFEYLAVPTLLTLAFLFSYVVTSLLAVFLAVCKGRVLHGFLRHFFSGSKRDVWNFFSASAFSTGAALIGAICLLFSKLGIVANFGLESAGYFDAAWSISSAYLAILVGTFSIYYLPTLSSDARLERRVEIVRKMFRIATIFSSVMICTVVSSKVAILEILYTSEFTPTLSLLGWMFVGDFFKICAWVLALVSVSKGHFRTFFITEFFYWAVFSGVSWTLGWLSVGLESVGLLYSVLYFILFLFYVFEVKIENSIVLMRGEWFSFFLGLGFICICSALSWGELTTNWLSTALAVIVLPILHYAILNKAEKAVARRVFPMQWRG